MVQETSTILKLVILYSYIRIVPVSVLLKRSYNTQISLKIYLTTSYLNLILRNNYRIQNCHPFHFTTSVIIIIIIIIFRSKIHFIPTTRSQRHQNYTLVALSLTRRRAAPRAFPKIRFSAIQKRSAVREKKTFPIEKTKSPPRVLTILNRALIDVLIEMRFQFWNKRTFH